MTSRGAALDFINVLWLVWHHVCTMLAFKPSVTSTAITALRALRSQVNPLYLSLRWSTSCQFWDANSSLLNSSVPPQVVASGHVQRCMSTQTDGEVRITKILKEKFPSAASLKVVDISGNVAAWRSGINMLFRMTPQNKLATKLFSFYQLSINSVGLFQLVTVKWNALLLCFWIHSLDILYPTMYLEYSYNSNCYVRVV